MNHLCENLAQYAHGMTTMFFVFIAFLLYNKRHKNSLVRFLCRVVIFWAAIFVKDVVYLIPGVWGDARVMHITVSIDMLCIPVFALFLFEVVRPGWASKTRTALMMLPSTAAAVVIIATDSEPIFRGLIAYSNLLAMVVAVLLLHSARRFDRYIKMNYSYTETINIHWLRRVIFLLIALLVVWSLVMVWGMVPGHAIYYLCSMTVFGYIYLQTIRHHVVPIKEIARPREVDADSAPDTLDSACIAVKLTHIMSHQKLFLNPLLTLRDVARAIGTNRTYLSEHLNRDLKTNFYDYVNSFRTAEASKVLLTERSLKLDDVATLCGFNSLSTFLRSFEKRIGTTPTKFRAKHLPPPIILPSDNRICSSASPVS